MSILIAMRMIAIQMLSDTAVLAISPIRAYCIGSIRWRQMVERCVNSQREETSLDGSRS
jgi:hypothetical protein